MNAITELFLKQRGIYQIPRTEYSYSGEISDDIYSINSNAERKSSTLNYSLLIDRINRETVQNRLDRTGCRLYLATKSETVVGYAWALEGADPPRWHDKVPVSNDELLLFDAFIDPEYRRQGWYSQLHAARVSGTHKKTIITVVETTNTPSAEANEMFGLSAEGRNILIKIFGINLLSIIRGRDKNKIAIRIDVPSVKAAIRHYRSL